MGIERSLRSEFLGQPTLMELGGMENFDAWKAGLNPETNVAEYYYLMGFEDPKQLQEVIETVYEDDRQTAREIGLI